MPKQESLERCKVLSTSKRTLARSSTGRMMSVMGIFRQLSIGWRLADPESDLSAVRAVGNLQMQIPEE